MLAIWAQEVVEHPGGYSGQVGDVAEHGQIVPVEGSLIVFAPGTGDIGIARAPGQGLASELTDNQRFIGKDIPAYLCCRLGPFGIPAHVFIDADQVQFPGESILHLELVRFRDKKCHIECRSEQAG